MSSRREQRHPKRDKYYAIQKSLPICQFWQAFSVKCTVYRVPFMSGRSHNGGDGRYWNANRDQP